MDEISNDDNGGFWDLFSFGSKSLEKDIRGDILIPQQNSLSAEIKYGSIDLSDVEGELNLRSRSSKIKLTNCKNVKDIDNNYGETNLKNCGGAL